MMLGLRRCISIIPPILVASITGHAASNCGREVIDGIVDNLAFALCLDRLRADCPVKGLSLNPDGRPVFMPLPVLPAKGPARAGAPSPVTNAAAGKASALTRILGSPARLVPVLWVLQFATYTDNEDCTETIESRYIPLEIYRGTCQPVMSVNKTVFDFLLLEDSEQETALKLPRVCAFYEKFAAALKKRIQSNAVSALRCEPDKKHARSFVSELNGVRYEATIDRSSEGVPERVAFKFPSGVKTEFMLSPNGGELLVASIYDVDANGKRSLTMPSDVRKIGLKMTNEKSKQHSEHLIKKIELLKQFNVAAPVMQGCCLSPSAKDCASLFNDVNGETGPRAPTGISEKGVN